MTDDDRTDLPNRRTVLRKTAALGAATTGDVMFAGTGAAQDTLSATYSPALSPKDGSTFGKHRIKNVNSNRTIEDVSGGATPDDVQSVNRIVSEAQGVEDSGSGELEAAIRVVLDDGTTETSAFQTVPFTVNGKGRSTGNSAVSSLSSRTQECEILFLRLEGQELRLLGLTITLSDVVLERTANSGPGTLFGNPPCAVTGLFDP